MNEHPILFSTEMILAILDNRKNQTRRVITPQPPAGYDFVRTLGQWIEFENHDEPLGKWSVRCPYWEVGDRLWVRESGMIAVDKTAFMYKAGGGCLSPAAPPKSESWCREWKSCPSIHMPRWASRITLEITGKRVERLQDITPANCKAEGISLPLIHEFPSIDEALHYLGEYNRAYSSLWDSINAKRGYSWSSNPWVRVVEFKKL